jgi:hypothetical protein
MTSVTVISPAVCTATQSTAAAMAAFARGMVTRSTTCQGAISSKADSSTSRSTQSSPGSTMSTTQGRPATA